MSNKKASNSIADRWKTMKPMLKDLGYMITDKRIKVEGKQVRVSIITLKVEEIEEIVAETNTSEKSKRTRTKKVGNEIKETEIEHIEKIIKVFEESKKSMTRYENITIIIEDENGEITSSKNLELLYEQLKLENKMRAMQESLNELEQKRQLIVVNRELAKVGKSKIDKEMFNALKNVGLIK